MRRHLPRDIRVRITGKPGTKNRQINTPSMFTNDIFHRRLQPIMLGPVPGLRPDQRLPALLKFDRLLFLAGVLYVLQRPDLLGRALDLLFPPVESRRGEVRMNLVLAIRAMKVDLRDQEA